MRDESNKNLKNDKVLNRREFIKFLGVIQLGTLGIYSQELFSQDKYDFNLNNTNFIPQNNENLQIINPPCLKSGDSVAFTAPASPVSKWQINKYINYFKSKGCNVIVCDSILNQKNEHRYLSGSDKERADELNNLFNSKKVKAIICGRGGYGVMRILDLLDYDALRKYPKIVMGYSDITALLLAIYRRSGIVTYHGPVGSSNLTNEHQDNMNKVLFSNKNVKYSIPDMKTIYKGEASGILQGGNLTLITSTMGTNYGIDNKSALLFIEDVSILVHEFDRMLNQLLLSNKLKNCKGIIFGKMKGLNKRGNFFPNKTYTMLEIMTEITSNLNVPVVYDVPFGHIQSSIILPIGLDAYLNTEKKYIEFSKKI